MNHPMVIAGCVILDNRGRLLLLHRKTESQSQWETPGGKIEEDEEPAEAARREALEELGTHVDILRELGRKAFVEDNRLIDYVWFLAVIVGTHPRVAEPNKFDDLRYFHWEDLRALSSQLSPNARNLVDAYFLGEIALTQGKQIGT